ncbi:MULTISPECIES: 16S rRNA (cytosine(1402)-N(4))-methyltransferase RsmH [Tissierellales]|uniref:Ribosomal RNA small subunit methyltransferase H n=1 Tax=Acidilutibacter cellobiosedens TaxID=2507161 RepID=A0A410QDM4_9FIRM|nr:MULTISPECIES: 16S rRNA (cytosine(1402)-N(4))-methyltransferase RsmH [Tissierellales]MBE6081913.1 16S rRNA (cytosine(1402)-N(4))-methyltransferase RsmH [Tissierellaceae bacterium]QAT62091.1 16S rRNA (cytosine(1402)-N(4))-methyltransferase RsmH [Acidilutibacter cellobiosedens]
MDFEHTPVLLNEVIKGLNIKKDGIYVDGTLGGAGHSLKIIEGLDNGKLVGIDQDMDAINKAKDVLKDYLERAEIIHDNFKNIPQILSNLNIDKVDGIFLDLGVSSYQFDERERGFSYQKDAPLDMRMDRENNLRAWDVVNKYKEKELSDILWKYGDERWSKRIAKFIVEERRNSPIDTTFQLVSIIKKAIPKGARASGHHPAKKTFQAIRIEVNKELEILKKSIPALCNLLKPKGRICIITFHSLEDRIVKENFKELNTGCICPKDFPICVCNRKKEIEIITKKPIVPTEDELSKNPRARSAKLRIGEKV